MQIPYINEKIIFRNSYIGLLTAISGGKTGAMLGAPPFLSFINMYLQSLKLIFQLW
ncbi:hypothetical protein D3C76_905210 [compost metagenome]